MTFKQVFFAQRAFILKIWFMLDDDVQLKKTIVHFLSLENTCPTWITEFLYLHQHLIPYVIYLQDLYKCFLKIIIHSPEAICLLNKKSLRYILLFNQSYEC